MQRLSGQLIAPRLQALLKGGALTGEWVIDSRKSSLRLKTGPCGACLRCRASSVNSVGTARGTSRPVSFDAAASIQGDGEVWLDAEVHINRADFGLTWNLMGMASMDNTLTIYTAFTQR